MIYDLDQLEKELNSLNRDKEQIVNHFNKICGAIEMIEIMINKLIDHEKSEQKQLLENKKKNK